MSEKIELSQSFRAVYDWPAEYRLARINGELVLQGLFRWEERSASGILSDGADWKTIPTVEIEREAGA